MPNMQAIQEITEEEKKAINELRKRMEKEIEQDLHDDVHLFRRFLAARDYDVDNAEEMLKKHIEWRRKNDVRNIFNFKKSEVVEKYFVFILLGFDKEGCPVRYCPAGNIDFIGILTSLKIEDVTKEVIFRLESEIRILKEQSEKYKKNVEKCVYIADLKNLSFAQCTDKRSINVFIFLIDLYINNYPETIKAIYVINVPIYFNIVYSLLKTLLPSKIMDKIFFYSNESYKTDILKLVDADELPAFLGGNQTDPDGNPLCLTKIKQAGERVPDSYFIYRSERVLSKFPGVQKVTLSRAAFHEVEMNVKEPGSYLEWEFETKCRDIGFGLFFNEIVNGEEKITELVSIQRIETDDYPETGTIKCEHPGKYVIVFDNTYSWVREKEIYYRVKVVSPEDYEEEINKK